MSAGRSQAALLLFVNPHHNNPLRLVRANLRVWLRFVEMNLADQYEISTEARRLDLDLIHDFLRSSYWAKGIPRSVVERSIKNSLCFGAFCQGCQVGFARIITDLATFAYVADVFVVAEHRGRGVSKLIMQAILQHPDLQGLRRILLATQDAHRLYEQFGFKPLSHPEMFMTIHHPGIYLKGEQ